VEECKPLISGLNCLVILSFFILIMVLKCWHGPRQPLLATS